MVRRELSEILQTEQFSHSKRYPALLRYVVEKKLSGEEDHLKERTLGIEVFQRQADYDTNSDTIVRFAASEVRRRLAFYYHEDGADRPIQIVLPPGSYIPEFMAKEDANSLVTESQVSPAPPTETAPDTVDFTPPRRPRWRRALRAALVVACLGLLISTSFFYVQHRQQNIAVMRFWKPFFSGSQFILICTGAVIFSPTRKSGVAPAASSNIYPFVSMDTATSISLLTQPLSAQQIHYTVQPTPTVTLMDLRANPAILVGAYSNSWTLQLLDSLPFRFSPQPTQEIYDSSNPATHWMRTDMTPTSSGVDYAIIARFRSSLTNNMVMTVAGLGSNGTEAAAQFVTSSVYLRELDRALPRGWSSKNIEVVLKTVVVDGQTGAPSIETYKAW